MRFNPVCKHKDPAIQTEINHIYSLLSDLAATSAKKIYTGSAEFTAVGTKVDIPTQTDSSYNVTITPVGGGSGTYTISRFNSYFIVDSNLTGEFLWAVISDI